MFNKNVEVVSIRHYSGTSSFKSIVQDVRENSIIVKLTKEFAILNFFEDDPVIIGYEIGREVYICDGTIIKVSPRNNNFEIKCNNAQIITDKRLDERYPVSLYAEITSARKRETALIKDISINGMTIKTKLDFSEGLEIELDAYLGKAVVPLRATIMWKKKEIEKYQYGVQFVYFDIGLKKTIKNNLILLKDEHEQAIRELKE